MGSTAYAALVVVLRGSVAGNGDLTAIVAVVVITRDTVGNGSALDGIADLPER